jgi:hypothetical protein
VTETRSSKQTQCNATRVSPHHSTFRVFGNGEHTGLHAPHPTPYGSWTGPDRRNRDEMGFLKRPADATAVSDWRDGVFPKPQSRVLDCNASFLRRLWVTIRRGMGTRCPICSTPACLPSVISSLGLSLLFSSCNDECPRSEYLDYYHGVPMGVALDEDGYHCRHN